MHRFTKIIYLLIFIMFLNSYGIGSSNLDYFLSAIILIIYLLNTKSINKKLVIFDYFPIIFILSWLYGFTFGLINGSSLYNAFFNFPGMLLVFLYYPLIYSNIKPNIIFKIFLYSSFILNLQVLYPILVGGFKLNVNDFMQSRQYYSTGLILQVVSFSFIFLKKNDIVFKNLNRYLIYFTNTNAILSFIVILLSFSKGFWLSLTGTILIIFSLTFLYYIKQFKISKSNIFIIIGVPIIFLIFLISNPLIYDGLKFFFSSEAIGNNLRLEQAAYLKNEFSFFGSGFGVPLKSGYLRDDFGFAFELSYYNFIHKIGIFSFFVFFIYIYLILFCIKLFLKFGPRFLTVFAISSLSFLLAASGNPLLFSSINMIILTMLIVQFKQILHNNYKWN